MPPDRSELPSVEFLPPKSIWWADPPQAGTRARLRSATRVWQRQLAEPFGDWSCFKYYGRSERRARRRSDAAGAYEPPVPRPNPCCHHARSASPRQPRGDVRPSARPALDQTSRTSSGVRLPFLIQLRLPIFHFEKRRGCLLKQGFFRGTLFSHKKFRDW